jgi:hypothetical protein
MATIDVQLIEGLGLPYAPGAEAGLLEATLAPEFNHAWQAFVAAFPGKTLRPLFDGIPVDQLADIVDGIRVRGVEPPNPFLWFTVACDDAEADAVVALLTALPMVLFARQRTDPAVALSVSYATNPGSSVTLQIQPAPHGVDAIYAWGVAGGAGDGIRVADIEGGWRLDHEELIAARINRLSVFGSRNVDHGTACAGIVVASDNGVGTVGIVPNAGLELITDDRGGAVSGTAVAILIAAAHLGPGDVLLLEVANPFRPGNEPEVLVEFEPAIQTAIGIATARDITVIEPAGNGGVDLDAFPFLAHTRPGSPTFSGAIVVGAAELNFAINTWSRTFSSFGSRVDCFAAGRSIRAPSAAGTNTYQLFGGTSGASAIIAGAAASLQGMTRAANRAPLPPADVRRHFSSALLGLLPNDPLGARIGTMPDLRKIVRAQGLVRVLPVAAAAIGLNALFMVHLDADNLMVRRHFTLLTGWGPRLPTLLLDGSPSDSDTFELVAAQPAVTSSDEVDAVARTVFDAFFSGRQGIHHMFWDTANQSGDVSRPIAPETTAAFGRAIAAVRPLINRLMLAVINPAGRLAILTGDPQILLAGMTAPLVLDPVGCYRRVDGAAIASPGAGLADVVAIEDGGSLNWFTGSVTAAGVANFTGPLNDPAVAFDPGARPALLAVGIQLLAAAVGTDGVLRVTTLDPVTQTVDPPVVVDAGVTIAAQGPVALGRTALRVVALAVDTQGILRAATRLIGGGAWTPLLPVPALSACSLLGGVTAVSIDFGVMAIAIGADGIVCSALSVDGLIWSPLIPLP